MKGNAFRWKTQIELIEKEVGKWLVDLSVQLKDLNSRYSSQINKTSATIDPTQMDQQLKLEQDKIDQWIVDEKKKIIEGISTLFKTSERHLEEMIKKNKFFTSSDTLKSRVFKDILPHFENHFNYLRDEGGKFLESLDGLNQRFIEFKERAIQIDTEAQKSLEKFKESLNLKLKDRDKLMSEFIDEKQEKGSAIVSQKEKIEELFEKIKEIIQIKQNTCLQEAQRLISWSLNDNQSELFSRPIQWIYMPVYAMFIENENNMEEYMNIIFPGYVKSDPGNVYEYLADPVVALKNTLIERIENDMAVRSNFEFSSENKNILKDPNFRKRIQQGLSKLREKALINEIIENKVRETLDLIH
jgi:hypothetical protein